MISPRNVGPDTILLFFPSPSSSSFFFFFSRVRDFVSVGSRKSNYQRGGRGISFPVVAALLLRVHKRESRGPMFSDLESFVGFEIRTSSEKFRNSIYFLLA